MYLAAPCNQYSRPKIDIADGTAEIRIAVRPDFFHAARAVHGSVYFKTLDDATFFAASSLVDDRGKPVARGTGTFMTSTTRLTEDIGYL